MDYNDLPENMKTRLKLIHIATGDDLEVLHREFAAVYGNCLLIGQKQIANHMQMTDRNLRLLVVKNKDLAGMIHKSGDGPWAAAASDIDGWLLGRK